MSTEKSLSQLNQQEDELEPLLSDLRRLVAEARHRALRAVDVIQVQTYWQVGRHLVEFEQDGSHRAAYGKRLLPAVADRLTAEFGKGFDERNLRHMRAFYQAFPIWNALRTELSWTHYRILSRVQSEEARVWYMSEAAEQNWSSRGQDQSIAHTFQRYTSDKLTPHFSADFSSVSFSFERGNQESESSIKISKGEESNFIWSVFNALIEQAIASNRVERFHFTLLRNLYEKTASFLGYLKWSELLPDDKQLYYSRIINFTSHSTLSNEAVTQPTPAEQAMVKRLLDHLKNSHGFWRQQGSLTV